MVEWNEQRLEELVRKMGLRRTGGQGRAPIHLSLYNSPFGPKPLLTKIMKLDTNAWSALGYDETDRISAVQCLGSLGCRTDDALRVAAHYQHPLTLELAKSLIDAGAFDKKALWWAAHYQHPLPLELAKALIDAGAFDEEALSYAARYQQPLSFDLAKLLIDAGAFNKGALSMVAYGQHPLTTELAKALIDAGACNKQALSEAAEYQHLLSPELAKLLIDAGAYDKWALLAATQCQRPLTLELAKLLISAGCDPAVQNGCGWDALVSLAYGGHPVDPQVTDLFLSAGCRTDLDGCKNIFNKHRLRFDQILKEHAEWKLTQECVPADAFYGPDWGR